MSKSVPSAASAQHKRLARAPSALPWYVLKIVAVSKNAPTHETSRPPTSTHARGFTLVEVLVALVVLSIGLLGMAKMVMVSSHSNDSAYLRSQATALAYQAMDSMRANLMAGDGQWLRRHPRVMPAPTGNCSAYCLNTPPGLVGCYGWKQHLINALPSGTGSITTSATFPVIATVVVQWDDSAAQSAIATATDSGRPLTRSRSLCKRCCNDARARLLVGRAHGGDHPGFDCHGGRHVGVHRLALRISVDLRCRRGER